jgi:(p)ppGpp synthase/HD superfamily hydrolase
MRVVRTKAVASFPHHHRSVACEERLEEAVHFLTDRLGAKGGKPRRGKKPVVLHSLRVGFALLAAGYPTDVVVAGFLHDIIEKTGMRPAQISRRFGADVGRMVAATTNDGRIHDVYDRYADSLRRCVAAGRGALTVRAADLIDNTDRALALGSRGRYEKIAGKLQMLVNVAKAGRIDASLLGELRKRLRLLEKVSRIAVVSKKNHTAAKPARVSPDHGQGRKRVARAGRT